MKHRIYFVNLAFSTRKQSVVYCVTLLAMSNSGRARVAQWVR